MCTANKWGDWFGFGPGFGCGFPFGFGFGFSGVLDLVVTLVLDLVVVILVSVVVLVLWFGFCFVLTLVFRVRIEFGVGWGIGLDIGLGTGSPNNWTYCSLGFRGGFGYCMVLVRFWCWWFWCLLWFCCPPRSSPSVPPNHALKLRRGLGVVWALVFTFYEKNIKFHQKYIITPPIYTNAYYKTLCSSILVMHAFFCIQNAQNTDTCPVLSGYEYNSYKNPPAEGRLIWVRPLFCDYTCLVNLSCCTKTSWFFRDILMVTCSHTSVFIWQQNWWACRSSTALRNLSNFRTGTWTK